MALSGSGWIEIEGERVELDAETFVRVAADAKRKVYAGPEGLRMLVIGGCAGRALQDRRAELDANLSSVGASVRLSGAR